MQTALLSGTSIRIGPDLGSVIRVQSSQNRVFRLRNALPFDVQVRILGNAPTFPQVLMVPAAGGTTVPIAYPDTSMRIQIRVIGGTWSPILSVPWRSGPINLPSPF